MCYCDYSCIIICLLQKFYSFTSTFIAQANQYFMKFNYFYDSRILFSIIYLSIYHQSEFQSLKIAKFFIKLHANFNSQLKIQKFLRFFLFTKNIWISC